MKKTFLLSALGAVMALGAFAAEDTGTAQLGYFTPAPGVIDLEEYDQGLASLTYANTCKPNTTSGLYATLKRDGVVVANVPVSNDRQIKFDKVMNGVWTLSFFNGYSMEGAVAGKYEVVIPAGYFIMNNGSLSEEIIINYEVPSPEMVPSLPSYSKVTELPTIVLTYPQATKVEYALEDKVLNYINLYGVPESEDDISNLEFKPIVEFDGNKVTVKTPNSVTTPGTWKLEGVENIFNLYDADGNVTASKDINLFYIIPEYSMGLPVIDPAEGDTDCFPGVFYLTLEKDQAVKNVNGMGVNYLYPVDKNGKRGTYIARYTAKKDPNNPRIVKLVNWNGEDAEIYPAPGDYELVTSDRLYILEGETGPDGSVKYISSMTFKYTVTEPYIQPSKISPEDGAVVEDLQRITFTFDDDVVVKSSADCAWLSSKTTNYVFWPTAATENNEVVFVGNTVANLPGEYLFTSGKGSVFVDGQEVSVVANYVIKENTTGVGCLENVQVLPANFNIYTADGALIKKNATVEAIHELPKGLYIIGNKKMLVP